MAQGFLISSQQISFPNYICPILMTWCLNTDHLGAKRDEPDYPGEIMLGLQLGPKMMILHTCNGDSNYYSFDNPQSV